MPSHAVKPHKAKKRAKDEVEEEADLEAQLFGTKKSSKKSSKRSKHDDDDEETGLGWMQDSDLFTVDAPSFQVPSFVDGGEESDDGSQVSDDLEPSFEFPEVLDSAPPKSAPGPVWHDPADDTMTVSVQERKRLRKLGRGKNAVDQVTGRELQGKLREQFERLHPKPEWASRRVDTRTSTIQQLLGSTESFLASGGERREPLAPSYIDIQRLVNANEQNPTAGKKKASDAGAGVVDVSWHPSRKLSVIAVAGGDRRVRLFNIDGHTNAPLVTLHIPSLPLLKATFHPSGSSLLLTGNRPFYYTYDLATQTCVRSPRNLFGSVESPTSPNALDRHAFSPDGTLLAVAGRRGCVSLIEWGSAGSTGVVVAELRSGRGGTVQDMVWSSDGSTLSVLGGRSGDEVEVWDVAERKVLRQWKDDRAYGGLMMRRGPNHTAIGSSTGIVNLYENGSLSGARGEVKSWKSLEHLTTPISAATFHPSGELLATASAQKKDALRLYHLPSGTAFSNWPTAATPLGRVSTIGFSPNGEFMSVGNSKGHVLLWSLKHYAA